LAIDKFRCNVLAISIKLSEIRFFYGKFIKHVHLVTDS
jgi:hypothetical protein